MSRMKVHRPGRTWTRWPRYSPCVLVKGQGPKVLDRAPEAILLFIIIVVVVITIVVVIITISMGRMLKALRHIMLVG